MVASEKVRIEDQARSLGKEGLESRAKELKEAIAQNEVCTLLHAIGYYPEIETCT